MPAPPASVRETEHIELQADSPDATTALATALAPHVACPDIVALSGELGTGKTLFARALIRAILGPAGRHEEVPSPTFTLVQTYDAGDKGTIWHFDLYRLTAPQQAFELDIEDGFATGICLIEWPDRLLDDQLPVDRIEIEFAYLPGVSRPDARRIGLTGRGDWASRLRRAAKDLRS